MNNIFAGSGVALVTPFNENGVDFEKLEKLIDFHLENQTDAIVVCGTTGEPSTMTFEEDASVMEFAINKVNKRIPVIVGTGSNDTKCAIKYAQFAENLGADALLIVSPYYNKATQKGLVKHYSAIAESVKTPIILYNVPGRTGVNILPSTVLELSKRKNIVAIKEASGNMEQAVELANIVGDKMAIYCGDDAITIPMMSIGAVGTISVVANIMPKEVSKMCHAYLDGDYKLAGEMQKQLYPLCKALFIEVSPIPVKTALNLMGYDVGLLRLPLCEMEEENLAKLKKVLFHAGLIK